MVRSTPLPTTTSSPVSAKSRRPAWSGSTSRALEYPGPRRPARGRPDRPLRLEARVRDAGRFRQGGLRQRSGAVEPGRPQATPLGRREYKAQGVDLTDDQCGLMTDFIRGLPHRSRPFPRILSSPTKPGPARRGSRRSAAPIAIPNRWVRPKGFTPTCSCTTWGAAWRASAGYARARSDSLSPDDKFGRSTSRPPASGEPPRSGASPTRRLTCTTAARPTSSGPSWLHGGEASGVTERFKALSPPEKQSIISFLKTLRAPRRRPGARRARPGRPVIWASSLQLFLLLRLLTL